MAQHVNLATTAIAAVILQCLIKTPEQKVRLAMSAIGTKRTSKICR